jgi:hypothetical protein
LKLKVLDPIAGLRPLSGVRAGIRDGITNTVGIQRGVDPATRHGLGKLDEELPKPTLTSVSAARGRRRRVALPTRAVCAELLDKWGNGRVGDDRGAREIVVARASR